METSGYLTRSMGSYYVFYIYWEIISINEATGTYKVYISWGIRKKAANSSTYNLDAHLWAAYGATTLLEGAEIAWDMRSASVGAEYSLYNTTKTVKCDENGNCDLWLYGYFDPGNLSGASAAEIGEYVTLPTIFRATKPVLSASSVDMGTQITIDLSDAKSSDYTHALTYKLPDGSTGDIAAGVGAEVYAWTVTDFASQLPATTSGILEIICTTYNAAGTVIGSKSVPMVAAVPADVVPVISAVAMAEAVSGIAEQFGKFVQSKSKLAVDISAEGAKGSSVTSVVSVFEGASFFGESWTSDYISGSGELSVVVTVTDSRGRSVKESVPVEVLAYMPPQIPVFQAWRVDETGAADDSGDYVAVQYAYGVPELNGGNTASMVIDATPAVEGDYTLTLLSGAALAQENTVFPATEITSDYRWTIRITIRDYFGRETEAVFPLPSAEVIADIKWDGTGWAFGKTSELSKCLDVNWQLLLRKGLFEPLGLPDGGTGVKTVEELRTLIGLGPLALQALAEAARFWMGAAAQWNELWRSTDPMAEFPAQTLTIEGLEGHNSFRFGFLVDADWSNVTEVELFCPEVDTTYYGWWEFTHNQGGVIYTRSREFAVTRSGNKLVLQTGYYGTQGGNSASSKVGILQYVLATKIRTEDTYRLEVDEEGNLYQVYSEPTPPLISFALDEDGALYAVYPDGLTAPQFELEDDGDLYYTKEV